MIDTSSHKIGKLGWHNEEETNSFDEDNINEESKHEDTLGRAERGWFKTYGKRPIPSNAICADDEEQFDEAMIEPVSYEENQDLLRAFGG